MNCKPTHHLLLALVLIATAGSSGCTSMLTARNSAVPVEDVVQQKQGYIVQIESSYSKDLFLKGELKTGMTIQQALDEQGLASKHKASDITILRQVPESGKLVKMACEFQPGKPQIKFEQDYALHPGDRILIQPKKTMLEKLVDR